MNQWISESVNVCSADVQRPSSNNSSVFKDSDEKGDQKISEKGDQKVSEKGDQKMAGFKTSLTLVVNDDPYETVRQQKKKPTGQELIE